MSGAIFVVAVPAFRRPLGVHARWGLLQAYNIGAVRQVEENELIESARSWFKIVESWCHQHDVLLAIALAFVFALVADLIRFGSLARKGVRLIRNKLAEMSEADLRARIDQQQFERARIATYLTSDKAMYMRAFYLLMQTLFMCMLGLVMMMASLMRVPFSFDIVARITRALALGAFGFAVMLCIEGMRLTSWDTKNKINEELARRDEEIEAMKDALQQKVNHRQGS
ncbi:MAG TPA: hypothetical protein VNX26_10850 [Candidatus Acidoferrum sp.]|nr:hypothetical protein [Candidatus Acidoferrum sp.]